MTLRSLLPAMALTALGLASCAAPASGPVPVPGRSDAGTGPAVPTLAVGVDAYRQWARLPYLRIGTRAYLRSTFDRAGGNEGADASHFLREDAPNRFVALDVAGPGELSFFRTNHWHGSPWHFTVDDADHVVRETSTADPTHPANGSVFLPESSFPSPLAVTWAETRGADLSWVPIPFQRSLSLAYERTHYGTGYYIYHAYPESADNLSRPIETWDESAPPADVVDLLAHAGDDIAPTGPGVRVIEGTSDVPTAGALLLAATTDGPGMVRALRLQVPLAAAHALSRATLRVTWDDRALPSIEAPVALFFGAGTLFNRDQREWLVRGLLANVRFSATEVTLAAYWPMPFFHGARFELVGGGEPVAGVKWQIRTVAYTDPPSWVGYFHATYRDHGTPIAGRDLVLLDTTTAEGGGDYCGSFAGTSFTFSDAAVLTTLEGDPRFFFDDAKTPQGQGTGTEEWGGGGDYWGGSTMTLPLAGHPVGAPSFAAAINDEDKIESAYRFLLADAMPFGKNARIQLEHGGTDESTEHYRTVTYWYGAPGACLTETDALHVGDPGDEAKHGYLSPSASLAESLTSRYEWGVDHVGATEIYPAETDTGRHMTGESAFTVQIAKDNHGVMLRREFDASFPDQRADVEVAGLEANSAFERAGTWFLAGSNACVYANPNGELDGPSPTIETSNRRFRDDEFLIPAHLTAGRSAIRVRVRFTPAVKSLLPGTVPAPAAWSEYRYHAYSYVLPGAP